MHISIDGMKPTREAASAPLSRDDQILRLIGNQTLLGCLPADDLLVLVRQSAVRTLPRNHLLFRCGDPGRSVVLILDGYVKLSATSASDRELVLEIAGPGTIFGELAVLNGGTRKADARTLTPCRVLAIDGPQFKRVIARSPDAMFAALRLLGERLSAATAQGMDAVSLPAPVRLAKALLHLAAMHDLAVATLASGCRSASWAP